MIEKRKQFRKLFFSSGIYSFLTKGVRKKNRRYFNSRKKIFGTYGTNDISPTGIVRFNSN